MLISIVLICRHFHAPGRFEPPFGLLLSSKKSQQLSWRAPNIGSRTIVGYRSQPNASRSPRRASWWDATRRVQIAAMVN